MKRFFLSFSAILVLLLSAASVAAQPPKVIAVDREELKPGKFEDHVRESNNFVRMLAKARDMNQPGYYRIGMTPIAGNLNEVTYLWFFDSLDEWARSQRDIQRWTTTPGPVKAYFDDLSAPMRGMEDMHTMQRSMIGVYRPDLSYNPRGNIGKARYLSVTTMRVKPGHIGDFMKAAQMYIGAMRKMKNDDHWAMYQIVGGGRDDVYMILSSMETLAEMDAMLARGGEFVRTMGDDMDDFEELVAKSLDPTDTVIYAFNPHMSHPPQEIMETDRAFWNWNMPAQQDSPARTRPASGRRQGRP